MGFFDDFIADFTPDQIKTFSKNQRLMLAVHKRDEATIRDILSTPDENVIVNEIILMRALESNTSNNTLILILNHLQVENSDQSRLSAQLVGKILDTQDIDLYDVGYERYLKGDHDMLSFILSCGSLDIIWHHTIKKNRLCPHEKFTYMPTPERKIKLMKCGLIRSEHNYLYDDQGQSKLPVNNLFMRCCADGRIDDVRRIINSHKTKK